MYIDLDEYLGRNSFSMALGSEFDVLDRGPDPSLDELTGLAAALCGASYAYVSLVDSNRIWFKSLHGFQASDQPRTETGCNWTLQGGAPLLISDAAHDSRFTLRGIELAGV